MLYEVITLVSFLVVAVLACLMPLVEAQRDPPLASLAGRVIAADDGGAQRDATVATLRRRR